MQQQFINPLDLRKQCLCGNNLEGKSWHSVFEGNKHYKEIKCTCGNHISVPVDFMGSGHDSWDQTFEWQKEVKTERANVKIKTLENTVQLMKTIK